MFSSVCNNVRGMIHSDSSPAAIVIDRRPVCSISKRSDGLDLSPIRILLRNWNWKSALLSSLTRTLVFFAVNLSAGRQAAVAAMLTEWVYRAMTSGFYGAITQRLSRVKSAWMGVSLAVLALPVLQHSIELLVHWVRHTARLSASIGASVCFTLISTAFHWYAMRDGVLIVGSGSGSLLSDLKRLPRIIFGFVCAGPILIWRGIRYLAASANSRSGVRSFSNHPDFCTGAED